MPATIGDLQKLFSNTVSALLALSGIVLFIMILSGGIKFITSGGDPKAVEGAKKTITYAVGGLFLILISYLILVFIGQITGAKNITNFSVTLPR